MNVSLQTASIHSNHSSHAHHYPRITSHRSETHIPRLGALQRTTSKTTIIDEPVSPGRSAPAKHGFLGGLDGTRTQVRSLVSRDTEEFARYHPRQLLKCLLVPYR